MYDQVRIKSACLKTLANDSLGDWIQGVKLVGIIIFTKANNKDAD